MNSTRWWAPIGAHLGPDAVDLAMLAVTGDDSRLDMGGVLLAAHRVGAAACLAAAQEPICDEGTLVNALAKARSELADPMVDGVSKCVHSSEESYAGLLVRDVLDNADVAAVDLFRAAVSKGVAAPVAATRAGAVYGVPSQELGRYRPLAIDPKANPASLLDAADRAVFKYCGELAAEETSDDVAKATATATQRIAVTPSGRRYYNERDENGEFTRGSATATIAEPGLLARLRGRYGMGGNEGPEVAGGPPSETALADLPGLAKPKRSDPKEKIIRDYAPRSTREANKQPLTPAELARRQQLLRRKPAKATAEPERVTQTRATHKRAQDKRITQQRKLQEGKIVAPKLQESLDREQHERVATPKELKASFQAPESGHWLLGTRAPEAKNYHTLDHRVGYVLDVADAAYFNQEAATSPGRLFRIGHLEKLHGGTPEDADHGINDGSYEDLVEQTAFPAAGVQPITGTIMADEIPESGPARSEALNRHQRIWADEVGVDVDDVSVLPGAEDDGTYYAVAQIGDAPIPRVTEYIVTDARGRVEGTGGNWHYDLDPNQAYRMPEVAQWQLVYDDDKGVIRQRIHLSPVDEPQVTAERRGNFGKAVATEVRSTTALGTTPDGRHYYNERDEHGEFTSSGLLVRIPQKKAGEKIIRDYAPQSMQEANKAPLTPAQLRYRQQLLRRKGGKAKPAQQDAPARATSQRTSHDRQLSQRGKAKERVQRKVHSQLEANEDLPRLNLDETRSYRIMDTEELMDVRYDNAGSQYYPGVISVRAPQTLNMLDDQNVKGAAIRPGLRHAYYDLLEEQTGQATKIFGPYPQEHLDDHIRYGQAVLNKIGSGAHGMVTEVPMDEDGDAKTIHASNAPESLVLVEFDDSADPNGPYDLVPIGEFWHRDTTDSADDSYTGGNTTHMNMRIERYLAVDPSKTQEVMRSRSRRRTG